MSLIRSLVLAVWFLGVSSAWGQEVLDVNYVARGKVQDGRSIKQTLYELAVYDVSMTHIRGLLGVEKADRNKSIIDSRVIKNSGKYILSVRGDKFEKKDDEYEMPVALKVSLKGLRALLLEQGLLYTMEGPPRILPVVSFVDRVGARSFGWWYQQGRKDYGFLVDQSEIFHKNLRESFKKIGFFAMAPEVGQYSLLLPDIYRNETLSRGDYLFMGEYFKSMIVFKGHVHFRQKPDSENIFLVDVKVEAVQSTNGRLMGEVVRLYETEPGPFKTVVAKKFEEVSQKIADDLTSQLADAWKQGTFGASLLRLAVVGRVSPRDLEEFKKDVVIQVRDIKSLRERLIEARRTTFEVDSSVLPHELAQAFRSAKFNRFKVDVEDVGSEGLTIKVQAL